MGSKTHNAEPNPQRKAFLVGGIIALAVVILGGALLVKVFRGAPKGTTDPLVKLRLERLFDFYQRYAREQRKPPPDEEAFKDFLRELPAEEKSVAHLEDVDQFLVSPRDGQKYVIRYGQKIDMGGATRAVAWEQTGVKGKRYVALSVGYVQECDEETFQSYKK